MKFGKFYLLDKIAVGGMAELFRAKIIGDQGFEKIVAIKRLLPHLSSEKNLVTSFIDEAKLAAFLQHQNIVQIYDFGTMDESYYIAMEFLTGKDLRLTTNKSKRENMPIGLETALYITSQICNGLDYAHRLHDFQGKPLGIIHRDISPPNILITYNGQVKVIDFGIAKARNQSIDTQVGVIKGKVAYMSPEQADGKIIDHRSDIFSTGILLYEMLARRRMFSGEDTLQVLAQVREARFKPPENVINCKYPEFFKILNRALAKDPDQRYASSGEMLSDIEKLLLRLSGRPTPQSISHYMHTLFGDEIKSEELTLRKVMQVNVQAEQENQEQIIPDAEMASTDTAQLGTDEDRTGTDRIYEETDVATTGKTFGTLKNRKLILAGIVASILALFIGSIFVLRRPFFSDSQDIDSGKNGTAQLEAGVIAFNEKLYSKAIDLFELILSENPSMKEAVLKPYTGALFGQASKLVQSDPEKAEKLLLRAVELNPESVEGFFQLGLLYVGQEDYNQAIIQYNNAAKLNPRYPNTFYNLGYIYAKTKNYPKAEEMFERTVALAPPFIDEALFNLAVVQEKLGKLDKGITSLEQALEANPDNVLAKKYLEKLKKK